MRTLEFLVAALASGRSLDIVPLPPVEQIPRDEDTDEFRAALREGKEVDPEWLAAEDARRAAGNRRRSRDRAAERALRDRVRAQLGMLEWRAATDPKIRAQELGIDPSYELPPSANAKNRSSQTLQTLFFPDRLEPKLSTLHSAARALQEDAGLSALHCAAGFLEWYETEDSPDPAFAPLVLLPINMEKRIANGEYIFSIIGRDDDETVNVALREKLRRLDLVLPDYDSEAGIETYLGSVAHAVKKRPRWRVRHFATIGLFSFSRQAMWSDLDPESWPAASRPETHPLLGQIYGDVVGEHSDAIAPVYDVDRPELEQQAPALVTDADASQLSAVIDAASGRNLVIQGPPGTGKSQAITNIIANALWHGKTILFVSEKMAALKVVKDRLDHMGLGAFCLEVHSAKASKTLVLKAIRERMESPRQLFHAQEIERARDALRQARERLTEYAALMNSPAGGTGLTVHQVLWGDFTRGALPDGVPEATLQFRLVDPLTIDRFKLADLVGAGKALDDLAAGMGAARPAEQPWRGVGNLNLNRFDRTKAVELMLRWSAALERLQTVAAKFAALCEWPALSSIRRLRSAAELVAELPDPSPSFAERLLPLASQDSANKSLLRWAELAIAAQGLDEKVASVCDAKELERHQDTIPRLLEDAQALDLSQMPPERLAEAANTARQDADRAARLQQIIDELLVISGRDPAAPADATSEAMAVGYLHHMSQLSSENFRYRTPALAEDDAAEELTAAQQIASEAHAAATEARFAEVPTAILAESIPAVQELRHAARVVRTTGFLGRLFGREWRRVRAVCRQTFPSERTLTSASRRLLAAALWKERLGQLEANATAKAIAGRHWKGTDTPFEALLTVANWMKSIRQFTPVAQNGARELRRLAYVGRRDDLTQVLELAELAKELGLPGAFQTAYKTGSTVRREAQRQSQRSIAICRIRDWAHALGVRPGIPIRAVEESCAAVVAAKEVRTKMANELVAVRAASEINAVSEAEKAATIKAALDHVARVRAVGIPSIVVTWLLQNSCSARSAQLKENTQDLVAAIAEVQQSSTAADQLLQLRFEEWCGGPAEDVDLDALSRKCRMAAAAADGLDKQITLLSTELEADDLGLRDLIGCWSSNDLPYAGVAGAVEAAFYRSAAEKLMRENPVLSHHAGKTHEQVRARFQSHDKEILDLNRRMIAAKLRTRPVPPGRRAASTRDYTDNEMLAHQTGLQQPRIALRRLFSNAGAAIRSYMPCIMISPMSVAQYLEPGKHSFDLLVVDEASQMKPEDALGAMLRCSQAVIVGDPEQLPPSDFFVAANDSENNETEDAPEESILELGRRCWHPMRMLEAHYRSRHHSLIAYSNREFYDERLLVYPSPVREDPDFGVSCRRIDGLYEVGQGRNQAEAHAIVDEAAALMRARLDRSIGIVAVNQAQRDLIEHLMDERTATDPDIQAYRQEWSGKLEDFFIKNLENVQGDERDIILISTVYGRNAEGVFHQHFGPINKAYGHRRLNVLFTRAKCKLTVFTSLDHTQIVADGNRRGVRVLKEFLEYATRGTVTPGRATGGEPESDFERWFLSRLKSAGYEAHPQVGVAKYRIDIGVVHPDRKGSYVLGVECDGATYHSSKSARDRDRLRQDVLEGLNWKIHRVWSTDWYRDPEREFARLVQSIERLRALH